MDNNMKGFLSTARPFLKSQFIPINIGVDKITHDTPYSKILDDKIYLKLALDYDGITLSFDNIDEFFNAINTLSVPELVTKYDDNPKGFWGQYKMPLDLLVDQLPDNYQLEKVQFCTVDDFSEVIMDDNIPEILNHWADSGKYSDYKFYYGPQTEGNDEPDDYANANDLLYQIRDTDTDKVITPLIEDSQLAYAIFMTTQSRDENDQPSIDFSTLYNEWYSTYSDMQIVPVKDPEKLPLFVNYDSWKKINPGTPLDESPSIMDGHEILECLTYYWTDTNAVLARTKSGIYSNDFVDQDDQFTDKIFQIATGKGLNVRSYPIIGRSKIYSDINYLLDHKDMSHINEVQEATFDKPIYYSEIIDNKTGEKLEKNIQDYDDLITFTLKQIWKKQK